MNIFIKSLAACYGHAAAVTSVCVHSLKDFFRMAARDAELAGEGLAHMSEASAQTQDAFRRDLADVAVDAGLAIAQDMTIEAEIAIAALQTAEKIANSPPEKLDALEIAGDLAEGAVSGTLAAAHDIANLAADLEKAGLEWEAHRPRCNP